jgi:excisionase family DNA binding protein
MANQDEVLTVAEVAAELRCSKAHVHNAINAKVAGVSPLPAIHMGRRKLVRRSALERWKRANERGVRDGMMPLSPEVDAVRPVGGEFHAS